jgi:Na+/H+-dicarboxylate symporter
MKNSMLIKVLIAIVLAVIAGRLSGSTAEIFGITLLQIYSLIGQLFLNALSLVVVPLVASSIITGMARMGSDKSFGTLGLKTFSYFILTTLLAIVTGLVLTLIISPGAMQDTLTATASSAIVEQSDGGFFQKFEQIFLKFIPSNILQAASQGQMLGLILFCMLFGYFMSKIEGTASTVLLDFWKGVFQVMMKITHLVMKVLPLGVFGLVAKAIATTGLETIGSVAYFFMTVIAGLAIYTLIILPLLLRFAAKINPLAHLKAMVPALVTAFSTTSSAATLPVTLECVEKRAGVSNRISSFILPLGTSVNLSGSSLYVCVSVLFIAQSYGVQLPLPSLILIGVMTLLTSLGTAGIPSASMISVVVILHTLGLPADGIGLIMSVERILDMFRTPVNVFGTSCCAVWAASSEGEQNLLVAASARPVMSE